MAIFGNFKGTTQSEFQIGKSTNGTKISTGTQPSSNLSSGDLWLNSANSTIEVYSGSEWKSIGSTLKELNVDSGTLFVDSSNDTVSIGSTSSNDKLFVNGSLRLGTNPSLKHSGAYLDVSHTNGSATQLRVRDNSNSGSDPIFKIYNANNTSEVFKVQGTTVTLASSLLTGVDTLRIDENGTGLRMTNVGAFDNSGGDFRIFSNGNLILATNGDSGTAVTFDATTKDATFQGNVIVNNVYTLPTSDGSANQVMKTDGSGTLSFGAIPASGSNTQVQFNDGGNLAGDSDFTFDKSDNTLTVTNLDVLGTFSHVEDYGSITQSANITVDYGPITTDDRMPTAHDSYTVSEAGNITGMSPGDMIFVSNETGGATMAFYDGTNWRRIQDRAVIS